MQALNREQLKSRPGDTELEAVIDSYELAFRMQQHAPNVLDLSRETRQRSTCTASTSPRPTTYGRQCLMARRLAEAGVRYIQVNYTDNSNNPAWDQHSDMPKHAVHAAAVDRPIAGLLADLKQRGLLEDTLVWWGGEFGRNPFAENNGTGRDHNPNGFTVWLAGGGVKPGFSYGATDEFGHVAVEQKVHMHDLHATILHLLGPQPQRADVPLRRPQLPPDRRGGRRRARHHRLSRRQMYYTETQRHREHREHREEQKLSRIKIDTFFHYFSLNSTFLLCALCVSVVILLKC